MALSDWRNSVIDLTNDSDSDDNETKFVLPPEGPSSAKPTSKSSNLPTSYPASGHHAPHQAGAHTLSSVATSASTYQAANLFAAGFNGTVSQRYAGGFGSNPNGRESPSNPVQGQGAKRRKLSVPKAQTPYTPQIHDNGASQRPQASTPSSQATFTGHVTTTTSGAKVRSTDKVLSVNAMKVALKTGAGSVAFLEETIATAPRPLHIGRLSPSTDVAPSWPPSSSLPAATFIEPPRSSLPPTNSHSTILHYTNPPSTDWASTSLAPAPSSTHDKMDVDTPLSAAVGNAASAQGSVGGVVLDQLQESKEEPLENDTHVDISDVPQIANTSPAVFEKEASNSRIINSTPATSTAPNPTVNTKSKGAYSEEDDHFLIFLKEVKKYIWRDITTEFSRYRPQRQYSNLQSRYSGVLNKRDRSQDPATLNLPPRFSAEATIDWATIHAEAPGPRSLSRPPSSRRNTQNWPMYETFVEQGYSSGADSGSRRERSRRAPAVNYNWKRLRTQFADSTEQEDEGSVVGNAPDESDSQMQLDMPTEDPPIPCVEAPPQNKPLEMQFAADDAKMGLLADQRPRRSSQEKLPYLNISQRRAIQDPPRDSGWDRNISHEWRGAVLHVDFSPVEMCLVEGAITKLLPSAPHQSRHSTRRRDLRHKLESLTEPNRLQLVHHLSRRLSSRSSASIKAFLDDFRTGNISEDPQVQRLATVRHEVFSSRQNKSMIATLRQRELGLQSRRGWKMGSNPLSYQTKNMMMDTLGSTWSWTGASSDIHTVAWSPNGEYFAAGAVAVTDQDSMQYNRPNNLLYGNVTHGVIHELGEHNIKRPKTEKGANSTNAMFETQDPKLYTTVSSVAFSHDGNLMYSAGYDQHVCIWEINQGSSQPTLGRDLVHKAEVDMMAVSQTQYGTVATAAKRNSDNSVKLITFDEDSIGDDSFRPKIHNYNSRKAVNKPGLNILPTALKFEPTYGRLLLAGFGANVRQDNGLDTTGDLCVWDIETQTDLAVHGSSRNVFDVTFNPYQRHQPFFAIGCVANGNVNRGTRSVIRLYSGFHEPIRYSRQVELECPALDMNDVVWCPYDEHLIATGCTNGRVYVWDIRQSDGPLHVLSHGRSLMPLQDDVPHEVTDTGVRFLSWGDNSTRLYSGSSDGVVKVWDVTRSQHDVHVKDLAHTKSGIMSGAFSPDFTKLLLGEVDGSVNVLEVGSVNVMEGLETDRKELRYIPEEKGENTEPALASSVLSAAPGSAAEGTDYLLNTNQLQLIPMGGLPMRQAVQGPKYQGPYDWSVDAPYLRQQALEFQLQMAVMPVPSCDISACQSCINKTTSEEFGDSGRSRDRIPDELRRQWRALVPDELREQWEDPVATKTTSATTMNFLSGKSKCTECNHPARPSTSAAGTTISILCERCSFACLRCGAANPVAAATTTLICDACAGVWDMGALGYECVQQPVGRSSASALALDVPLLKRSAKESYADFVEDADETSFGDEVNALSDYYFSLAFERPESPPL